VEQHYPVFVAVREAAGRPLPGYVQQEFEKYILTTFARPGYLRRAIEAGVADSLVRAAHG
jgi:hypothetical protein